MLTDGCEYSLLKVVVLHCRRTRSRKARISTWNGVVLRVCARARAESTDYCGIAYYSEKWNIWRRPNGVGVLLAEANLTFQKATLHRSWREPERNATQGSCRGQQKMNTGCSYTKKKGGGAVILYILMSLEPQPCRM